MKRRKQMTKPHDKILTNQILINHAAWLQDNGEFTKAKDCKKQAVDYINYKKDKRLKFRKGVLHER